MPPYGVKKITSADGELYYERPPNKYKSRVVDASKANELTLMMRRVVDNGTGQKAKISAPSAGKTGTTQESRDAWFVGFTDRLVTSVWLGNDDNTPMNRVTGGSFPANIWRTVMRDANPRYSRVRIKNYSGFSGFSALLEKLLYVTFEDDEYAEDYILIDDLMNYDGETINRQDPRFFSRGANKPINQETREYAPEPPRRTQKPRPSTPKREDIDNSGKKLHERSDRYN